MKFETFINFFTKICSFLSEQQLETIIMGDFNINLLPDENGCIRQESMDLFLLCREYELMQLITEPTHDKGALLDHIYISNRKLYAHSGSFPYAGSDHSLCYTIRKQEKIKIEPKIIKVRNWNKINWKELKSELCLFQHKLQNGEIEGSPYLSKGIDRDFDKMNKFAVAILNKHAPEKKMLVRGKFSPWLTADVRCSMKLRNKMHKIAKNSNLPEDWKRFRQARNSTNNLVTSSKKRYFSDKFEKECKSEDMWETINKLTNYRCKKTAPITYLEVGKKRVYEKSEINDIFADTFVVKGEILIEDDKLILDEIKLYEENYDFSNTKFNDKEPLKVEHNDVLDAVNSLNVRKSHNPDNLVPLKMIKNCGPIFVQMLVWLFTIILNSKSIPTVFKRANVMPLFKGKGSSKLAKNFRPISLLTDYCKIFEKII